MHHNFFMNRCALKHNKNNVEKIQENYLCKARIRTEVQRKLKMNFGTSNLKFSQFFSCT